MTSELTKGQKQLIDHVAAENGFTNYELRAVPGSAKGDNFASNIVAVTIKDGENHKEFILKSGFTDMDSKKPGLLKTAYQREMFLYSKVFEEFKRFEKEHNISNPFNSITKLYGYLDTDEDQSLLMENLREAGYELWNKMVPMNREHMTEVLNEYGKFHAISFAMHHKNPKLFEELSEKLRSNALDDVFPGEQINNYISSCMKRGYEAVDGDPVLTEYLKKLESKTANLIRIESRKPEYMCVIKHGDCWCNNFMFKYQDPSDKTTPSAIRILDWQISSLSTPGYDFAYFFTVHSHKDTFHRYDSYLEIYYEALSNQLKCFGCDPEQVFPFSRLKKHCALQMETFLFQCIIVMKIMLTDSEDAPNFCDNVEDSKAVTDRFDYKMKNMQLYNERVKDLVQFMVERNFDN